MLACRDLRLEGPVEPSMAMAWSLIAAVTRGRMSGRHRAVWDLPLKSGNGKQAGIR